ncbi:MAG: hypothetical protein IKT68_02780 [Clostridia bacterium]|nr:hypothetical protein [Clostridia bacterium]
MKYITTFLLIMGMVFSLVACSNQQSGSAVDQSLTTSSTAQESQPANPSTPSTNAISWNDCVGIWQTEGNDPFYELQLSVTNEAILVDCCSCYGQVTLTTSQSIALAAIEGNSFSLKYTDNHDNQGTFTLALIDSETISLTVNETDPNPDFEYHMQSGTFSLRKHTIWGNYEQPNGMSIDILPIYYDMVLFYITMGNGYFEGVIENYNETTRSAEFTAADMENSSFDALKEIFGTITWSEDYQTATVSVLQSQSPLLPAGKPMQFQKNKADVLLQF